jgi:hypothetical protein
MTSRTSSAIDWNGLRSSASQESQDLFRTALAQSQAHAANQQLRYNGYGLRNASLDYQLSDKAITFNTNMKKVYEYVAYYAPTPEEAKANKGIDEAIILEGKLIADSEQTARTKVTRMIPDDYDTVIDKVKIEIRSFR